MLELHKWRPDSEALVKNVYPKNLESNPLNFLHYDNARSETEGILSASLCKPRQRELKRSDRAAFPPPPPSRLFRY